MELVGGASHFSLLAADAAAAVVSGASTPSETRVRGIDLAAYTGTWSSTPPSAETHWGSTYSYGELAADRQEVTNLRLPGQYDERLFAAAGISGMQGPYYNGARWYLPSVGRYLELDPIALEGGFNATFGVDWYNYANGNPLRFTDPDGTIAGVDDAALLVLVGGAAVVATWEAYVAQCTASGTCPWDAATKCERSQCKLEYHGPHHNFPVLGRRCHIQLTCWKPGVKGSTSIIRIPAPCVGDYK